MKRTMDIPVVEFIAFSNYDVISANADEAAIFERQMHKEEMMKNTLDLTTIDWKKDRITQKYVDENRKKLSDPTQMEPRELGEAITYCRIAWNPYADELMRRSGHLDEFRQARTDKERSKILDKSCRYHGFMLY